MRPEAAGISRPLTPPALRRRQPIGRVSHLGLNLIGPACRDSGAGHFAGRTRARSEHFSSHDHLLHGSWARSFVGDRRLRKTSKFPPAASTRHHIPGERDQADSAAR